LINHDVKITSKQSTFILKIVLVVSFMQLEFKYLDFITKTLRTGQGTSHAFHFIYCEKVVEMSFCLYRFCPDT